MPYCFYKHFLSIKKQTCYLYFKAPPVRLLLLGPRGSGKTLHGRQMARKMGLFHISFKDRLQELIMHKTKKKIGPEFEEDNEEEPPEE